MSFGLIDYGKSIFASLQKPDEIKKTAIAENTDPEVANNSEKGNDANPKTPGPIQLVKNDVTTYKDGGDPSMLDFGLFDYKHNQKYNPESNNNPVV